MKLAVQGAVAALLLLVVVDAHGGHHHLRKLLGNNGNSGRNKHGLRFDFSDIKGGAKGFLDDIEASDPAKLQRITTRAGWKGTKDNLAKQLEEDADLVSGSALASQMASRCTLLCLSHFCIFPWV